MNDAPYQSSSVTSKDAAVAIRPHLQRLCLLVLNAIDEAGAKGLTREELESITGLAGNTIRPRVRKLLDLGLIRPLIGTALTKSGRRAEILVIA